MRIRPLGWELTTLLVALAAFAVVVLLRSATLAWVLLLAVSVAMPLAFLSAGARLVAGIIDEDRRHRRARAIRRG